jgi:hypothetical protein
VAWAAKGAVRAETASNIAAILFFINDSGFFCFLVFPVVFVLILSNFKFCRVTFWKQRGNVAISAGARRWRQESPRDLHRM